MSDNQPREYDAVLGGGNQTPVDGVVLGGIEGVKRRLQNPDVKARIAGLYQALNYGEAGLDLVIQALWDDDGKEVQTIAYSLLEKRVEKPAKQTLQECSDYQFFDCIVTLQGHESNVNSVCITPDGENIISGSENNIILWKWQEKLPRVIYTVHNKDLINSVVYNSRIKSLLIRSKWGEIQHIDCYDTSCVYFRINNGSGLHHSLHINQSSDTIFIGNKKGVIKVQNCFFKKRKFILGGHTKPILSLAVYGHILFSGSADNTIKIWDWLGENKFIRTLEEHSSSVTALCLTEDGKTLFSGSGDNTIKIWDWQQGELIRTLEGHSLGVNSLAIAPDGKTLISASNDTTIKVWNWKSGKLQATLTGHSAEVNSIALSPNGKHLFSGSSDKTVKVWGLE
ncbi:MAG: WD40 repeat domain-containing protein [Rivularia sp. (in: cyanobacteria)]